MEPINLTEKLIQETKYSRLYLSIIANAQAENRKKLKKQNIEYIYFENHHILPRSIFPEYISLKDNPWNGVLLTAREHFICHILIMKHYKSISYTYGERKMGRALDRLSKGGMYISKNYSLFRVNLNHSEETIQKIRDARKNQAPMTQKTKDDIGLFWKDTIWTKNQGRIDSIEITQDTIIGRDCSWMKGKVTVLEIESNKHISISQAEFYANKDKYKSLGGRKEATVGTTMVYDDGKRVRVSIEEKNKKGLISIHSGSSNGRALKLELYNSDDKLVGVKEKDEKFRDFCKRLEVDDGDCRNSYLNGTKFLKSKKSKYFKKNGWYSVKC